ncbi:MAG: VOC family protein [Gammaproteobacteria bacterium]|nr:VOC family protein [Gammaproteobacteria bacterium]
MRLAKPHIDIGLFTTDIAAHSAFWGQTMSLRLDHKLEFGTHGIATGMIQHRYDAHGSVIKVNHYPGELPRYQRSGYVGLTIARADVSPWDSQHPEGDRVLLVAPGTDGVVGIGITVSTPEPARMMDFYLRVMEFDEVNATTTRCGDSLLFVEKGPVPDNHPTQFIGGRGFRYLTVQIFDADLAVNEIVARGGRLGQACVNFGEVARYGFVLDPDGGWIEMSARTSLTGIKPPIPAARVD